MTVRNVRSYQTRGLIPPPQRQGRRSVYLEEHLRRLREIHSARQRGASLTLIAMHLSAGGNLSDSERQRNWIPRMLAGQRRRQLETRPVPISALLAGSPEGDQLGDQVLALTDAGVLIQDGDDVLADPQTAAMLAAMVDRGLNLALVFQVMLVSAAAAGEIGKVVEGALPAGRAKDWGRRELLNMVQLTFDASINAASINTIR